MSVKIIIAGKHSESVMERFRNIPGCEPVFVQDMNQIKDEDLQEAEIFVGPLKKELRVKMPKLRFVQLLSAGAGGYGWLDDDVVLANAYGAYGDSIAEHMLTVTLMAMKRMPEYFEMSQRREWQLLDDIVRFEGSKILSVGMGAIGSAYLKRAYALGAECYGIRRTVHEKPDYVKQLGTPADLDDLLPEMDVVALSMPGTPETKAMFDRERLMKMKKTAVLINVGRGNSVVTDDLIEVMISGHLKAACLDVMDPEPLPKDHPLWSTRNVYITPHISGGFRAGVNYERVMDLAIRNVARVMEGKEPVHAVDRSLGY